jgi:alanine dehydrogenase
MIIGVPRERKTLEKRVALTPDGAKELTKRGHTVLIEKNAGLGSFFSNESYKASGCTLVDTLEEVWTKSDLVVKVKEPHESEYQYFRKGLTVFDYLHLAGLPEVTHAMLKGGVTGIAYELVQLESGALPLLEPMSEVAGKLSVLNGSYFLLAQNGGRGTLLGGTTGVPPADVTVVGAGIAGRAAATVALGMGARVTVLDISQRALERIRIEFQGRARTVHSTAASLERHCSEADLVIGAVLVPGAKAPALVTTEMVKAMMPGSVLVDISIDQGGCVEGIRTTSLETPTYEEHGVIHYAVPNMPAQTARTSTQALTAVTLPYIVELADHGIKGAFERKSELKKALNTHAGMLTNELVSDAVGPAYTPIDEVVAGM